MHEVQNSSVAYCKKTWFDVNKVCVSLFQQSSDSEQNITYSTVSHIRGSTQQVKPNPFDRISSNTT